MTSKPHPPTLSETNTLPNFKNPSESEIIPETEFVEENGRNGGYVSDSSDASLATSPRRLCSLRGRLGSGRRRLHTRSPPAIVVSSTPHSFPLSETKLSESEIVPETEFVEGDSLIKHYISDSFDSSLSTPPRCHRRCLSRSVSSVVSSIPNSPSSFPRTENQEIIPETEFEEVNSLNEDIIGDSCDLPASKESNCSGVAVRGGRSLVEKEIGDLKRDYGELAMLRIVLPGLFKWVSSLNFMLVMKHLCGLS